MNMRSFTIPLTPTSKNPWTRMHWSKRAEIKQEWESFVWAFVNEKPRMPRPLPHVRCDVVVGWDKPGPFPDNLNLEMAFECIADGLVKAGIIPNDRTEFERGTLGLTHGSGETTVILRWETP